MDIQQFGGAVLDGLARIERAVTELKNQKPPVRAEDRITKIYLSSIASTSYQDIAGEGHIVGILLSDSSTGRGTLNVDSESIPFYTLAYQSQYYRFGPNDLVFRGGRASWTPPGASDAYDVVLFVRMR